MNINEKNYPHNVVFCEMLQSVIDGAPKTVQYRGYEVNNWSDLPKDGDGITESGWNPGAFYRIKPPESVMITRTVTYTEPITVAPAIGTDYFVCLLDGSTKVMWAGDDIDKKWLAAGVCHPTREAAQEQWDAFYKVQQ